MNNKWADYLISAVRYDIARTHIDSVQVHQDNGVSVGSPTIWKRSQVVAAIANSYTFVTIYLENNTWKKGEDVRAFRVGSNLYLRTDRNNRASDNLGNLPEF